MRHARYILPHSDRFVPFWYRSVETNGVPYSTERVMGFNDTTGTGTSSNDPNMVFRYVLKPIAGYKIDSVNSPDIPGTWFINSDGFWQLDRPYAELSLVQNPPPVITVTTSVDSGGGGGEPAPDRAVFALLGDATKVSAELLDVNTVVKALGINEAHEVPLDGVGKRIRYTPKPTFQIDSVTGLPSTKSGDVWFTGLDGHYDNVLKTINVTSSLIPPPPGPKFKINPIIDKTHIESMTLNGEPWDGNQVELEWKLGGNIIVINYLSNVVIDKSPSMAFYDSDYNYRSNGSRVGNTFTGSFIYQDYYDGKVKELKIESTMAVVEPDKTLIFKPTIEKDHIESMVLNGEPWDGEEVELTWKTGGNTLVINYLPEAVIDPMPDWRVYNTTTHEYETLGRLTGQTYTVTFTYEPLYDGKVKSLEIVSFMEVVEVSSPFNRLYLMDREKMTDLAGVMPTLYHSNVPGGVGEKKDMSGYILNLLLMPFQIPEDVIGTSIPIKIGDNDTQISAPMVIDDSIEIDLGTITVAGTNSVTDFVGVEYELYLPFCSKTIKLDPSEIVGKPITVKYDLDAYTGDVTVNVFNGGEYPFVSETDRVARDIPFRLFDNPTNKLGQAITMNNGLLSAYIKETRVELVEGTYNNLILVNGILGDSTGYVEVEYVDLVGVPETDKVLGILKGGVVIR